MSVCPPRPGRRTLVDVSKVLVGGHQWAVVRRTDVTEYLAGNSAHRGLMSANFTTLPHFSVSSAMSLPKSPGELGSAVEPNSASRASVLGSARAALIPWLSLSTISMGVLRGAPMPVQKLNS